MPISPLTRLRRALAVRQEPFVGGGVGLGCPLLPANHTNAGGGDFPMRWTADRQRLLADMSASGLGAGRIAREIGETKSAVANAMGRYGLFARARLRLIAPRDESVPQSRG